MIIKNEINYTDKQIILISLFERKREENIIILTVMLSYFNLKNRLTLYYYLPL
jgi:hypothetical protein